jgi:hypothetical protein
MATAKDVALHKLNKKRAEAGLRPLRPTATASPLALFNAQKLADSKFDEVLKPPTFAGQQKILVGDPAHRTMWRIPSDAIALPTMGGNQFVRTSDGAFHLLMLNRAGDVRELIDPPMMRALDPELRARFAQFDSTVDGRPMT